MNRDGLDCRLISMARIGSCSSPSFSPDGKFVALISNLSEIPQVWIVPVEGGWPRMVTALRDPVTALEWRPDSEQLALLVAPNGGMNQQIFLVNRNGTCLQRLTDGGGENNTAPLWNHGGNIIAFSSNRDNPSAMDGFLFDFDGDNFTSRMIVKNPGVGYFTDVSRDGKRAIIMRKRYRGDNDLILLTLREAGELATEHLLTPHEPPGSFCNGKFSPDGNTIYLASNADREFMAFGRVVLDDYGKPGPIEIIAEHASADLEIFCLGSDGRLAALVWNNAGRSELALMDLESLKTTSVPVLPAPVISEIVISNDTMKLALTISGANCPQDIWIFDLDSYPITKGAHGGVGGRSAWHADGTKRAEIGTTASFRQLTYSPHPGVDLDSLVVPELVSFPAHDGLVLTAWLYHAGNNAGRLVMSFHGGPESQERPVFSTNYQALLQNGISVLAPNVRGSTGFGKTFVNLDNGALRFNAIKDIKACIDFVIRDGIAQSGKLGIMGGSYGGYMTMVGLVEYPDLIAAGACLYGLVNFETFFAQTEPWMAAISKNKYGDPGTQAELLRQLSPIHRVDRVFAPTLVIHGATDTNCPVVEAEQVVESLKKRSIPCEYILFPDEGHGFRKIPNRLRATEAIVKWFDKYLS